MPSDEATLARTALEVLVGIYREQGIRVSVDSAYRTLHTAAVGVGHDEDDQHAGIPRRPSQAEATTAYELRRRLEAAYPAASAGEIAQALHAAAAQLLCW